MEGLVEFFIELFGGINKELVIFIISLMPILELRGGLLAATLLDVEFVRAAIICILGNVLPIPFVLLFLNGDTSTSPTTGMYLPIIPKAWSYANDSKDSSITYCTLSCLCSSMEEQNSFVKEDAIALTAEA